MIHRLLGHFNGKSILVLLVSGIFGFIILSGISFAQDWFEPKTQPPGVAANPENRPDFIRVKSLDPTERQFKQGNLRLGSITTTDLSNTLEIYGDFGIKDSLLIAAEGECNDDTGVLNTTCRFSVIGEKHPTFLVQKDDGTGDQFVGVGTNVKSGLLSVYSNSVGEAIYATSANVPGVWGKSVSTSANVGRGIQAFSSAQDSVSAIGKSVGPNNYGVYGVAYTGAGSKAGYFKDGNVAVFAGYIQGNGSELIRVYNISDNTYYSLSGGRGLGVWAKRNISIQSETSEDILTPLSGETLRSYSVLVKKITDTDYKLYNPSDAYFTGLTFSLSNGSIQYTNSQTTRYDAIVTAHLETGVAIIVKHFNNTQIPGADPIPIGNLEPILYRPKNATHYVLEAELPGETPPFTWTILNGGGSLCPDNAGIPGLVCSTLGNGVSGSKVYYKYLNDFASYGIDRDITIKIEATGSTADFVKQITLRVTDVTPNGINWFTVEQSSTKDLSFSVVPPNAGDLKFDNGVIGTTYSYSAPGDINTTNGQPVGLVSFSLLDAVSKDQTDMSVYHVPTIDISTTFPDDGAIGWDTPQVGVETSTVALNKPLNVTVSLGGFGANPPNPPQISCQCGSESWSGSYTGPFKWTNAGALGPHPLTITWDPLSAVYPSGLTYVQTKYIIVGTITKYRPTDITLPVTVEYYLNGYGPYTPPGGSQITSVQHLSNARPLNDSGFHEWAPLPPTANQHIGFNMYNQYVDPPANTILISNCNVAINQVGTNQTNLVLSDQPCGDLRDLNYGIVAVNPNDIRDYQNVTLDYSVPCGCPCIIGNCGKPGFENEPCCTGGDVGG